MMTTPELVKRMLGLKIEMLQVSYDMTFSVDESIQEHSLELMANAKTLNNLIEHLVHKEIT